MTDVPISGLPAAAAVSDTDLIPVVEIGSPNVTKRATAAQMRAPLLPLAGGTLTGSLTISGGNLTVSGTGQFNNTVTMNGGGGWSSSNVGKQLLITTPTGVSNPGIAIPDGNFTNFWGIWNNVGTLRISSMPLFSDSSTAPSDVLALSTAGATITGTVTSSGKLTVSSGGAAITGNSSVTGTFATSSTLGVLAGGISVTGNSTIAGTLSSLTGLTVTGAATINGALGGLTGLTVASGGVTVTAGGAAITGTVGLTGDVTINSGALTIGGTKLGSVTNAGEYGKTTATYGVTGGVSYSVNATGVVVADELYAISDRRAKTDIRSISAADAWRWLKVARAVTFMKDGRPSAGFIAQEDMANGRGAAVTFMPDDRPEFVESDGFVPAGYRAVRNYEHEIAYLTAALQDVQGRLTALESA